MLCMVLLLPIVPYKAFANEPDYGYVEFYNTENNKVEVLDGENSLYAKVYFKAPSDGDAVVLIAKYTADDRLLLEKETVNSLTPGEESAYTTK